MRLIAAVDKNWGIGLRGRLLTQIREDQLRFRRLTMGKVVVMGRKTFESIQGGRPLPGRRSFVLSADPDFAPRSMEQAPVQVFRSLDALKKALEVYAPEDVFVIGGETMYRQLLPLCDEAEITYIDYAYEADAYCPDLDADPAWKLVSESDEQISFNLEYYYRTYIRERV